MAHSKGFSVPEALQDAPLVEFETSSMAGSYCEIGIILKFVKGYTPSQAKREEKRRKSRGSCWTVIEEHCRAQRSLVPLRNLDVKDYALVLYFDGVLDDYVMSWVEISNLKPEGHRLKAQALRDEYLANLAKLDTLQ